MIVNKLTVTISYHGQRQRVEVYDADNDCHFMLQAAAIEVIDARRLQQPAKPATKAGQKAGAS